MTAAVKQIRKLIGKRLQELRRAKEWSQAEVARRAKVSRDFVGRCERGDREPSLFVLLKLSHAFGVPPHHFLLPDQPEERAGLQAIAALLHRRTDDEVRWVQRIIEGLLQYPQAKPVEGGTLPTRAK